MEHDTYHSKDQSAGLRYLFAYFTGLFTGVGLGLTLGWALWTGGGAP